jgi:hypothetical protein
MMHFLHSAFSRGIMDGDIFETPAGTVLLAERVSCMFFFSSYSFGDRRLEFDAFKGTSLNWFLHV